MSKKAVSLFDEPVVVAVDEPAVTPETLWSVIDGVCAQIQTEITAHQNANDIFRNRRYAEAFQHLARASKLLRGE